MSKISAIKCYKCGHVWSPHKVNSGSTACGRCKAPYNSSNKLVEVDVSRVFLEYLLYDGNSEWNKDDNKS
jgi:predicted  nucleic acid-binding Zn-ribbon protein